MRHREDKIKHKPFYLLNGVYFKRYLDSFYYVSEKGQVFSFMSNVFLKPCFGNGYLRFDLRINGKIVRRNIHRLIAECYIPNPNNLPVVRHLNDIKSDVSIQNLAWGTRLDNVEDAKRNNLYTSGENHYKAKLTSKQVLSIREDIKLGVTVNKIAKKYNMDWRSINDIRVRKSWKNI